MEIKAHMIIDRIRDNGTQTIGNAWVLVNGELKLKFVTLEPSWVLNQPYISCAPVGTYTLQKRVSPRFKEHFELVDVPERELILIHALNFFRETEGCIGPGSRFQLIDDDHLVDVSQSGKTMTKLNKILPEETQLTIKENQKFQTIY